jgi:hypothetical protein
VQITGPALAGEDEALLTVLSPLPTDEADSVQSTSFGRTDALRTGPLDGPPRLSQVARYSENLAAADLELTPGDLADLDAASASMQVQGARYPEAMQKMIDR